MSPETAGENKTMNINLTPTTRPTGFLGSGKTMLRPLSVGAGVRVAVASVIAAALWAGFFWVTSSLGAL